MELEGYWDFLLGREPLPIENGVLSLMESAVAIHTRVQELTAMIQLGEYHGTIPKGSNMYRLRTGPLRQIIEASKYAIELGSRRVTIWAKEQDETRSGLA